ncbi:nicotinate phosphoribosyltransferase [Rarobacter faecitabidus]|uniref:Nicotinate phosphoribosyltransferase n=2 Tax=Rarobacter faecitabidus TaxID=13243 RepID=A0A542ZWU1_RARFA|nr:nicotinate phosphoribosyltransferase [Rarobacter faecitabidus]
MRTDMYELTMLRAALADGTAERRCRFEVFTRRLPSWRRYGVLAGTGRFLEQLAAFRFSSAELGFLLERGIVDEPTAAYLENYRFNGTISGLAEGEVYFPGTPLLSVVGTFAEAVVLETLVLSVLNFDSAVAAAASRMTSAAGTRPCLDMGARRTHEDAALAAARAAVVGGFTGTSNLAAGALWEIPTIGTAAHAFTLLHDNEEQAFASQVAAFGPGTTLLVDTYDIPLGVRRAIEVAGSELGAVRIDSGDLGILAREVRAQLDAAGATETKITVTSDLDEYAIASLSSAPVDSFGVGTRLVTGSGAPTCSMVYKLAAREAADGSMVPVAKASAGKPSVGGFKRLFREVDDQGRASADLVAIGDEASVASFVPSQPARDLTVTYVRDGEIDESHLGAGGLRRAAEHHRSARDELPLTALRLSSGEPALPVRTATL